MRAKSTHDTAETIREALVWRFDLAAHDGLAALDALVAEKDRYKDALKRAREAGERLIEVVEGPYREDSDTDYIVALDEFRAALAPPETER